MVSWSSACVSLSCMRRLLALCAFVLALACVVGGGTASAAPSVRSLRNAQFEIVGLDVRSVSYVYELSQFTVQISSRYLEREGLAFPLPILVSLRPEEHAKFEGDYRIRIEDRGAVQLDIRWEDPLTLERTCYAMVDALLVQYAVFNYGAGAEDALRAWPISALTAEVYNRLRPANYIDLVNRARSMTAPALSEVVTATRTRSGNDPVFGFWLLNCLKNSHFERPVIRSLMQQSIAGVDVEAALKSVIEPNAPTAEPMPVQLWWEGQLNQLLGREYEVVESMATSRAWMSALARFDEPLVLESGEVSLNLRSLWRYRTEPELREMIEARYQILRLRMLRINPAYFNAAKSLGALFEALLTETPSHLYIHSMAIYLSDWGDAQEMQDEIEMVLE